MIQPLFLSVIGAQPHHDTFLISDHETVVRKNQERQSDGVPCLDKPVLAAGGRRDTVDGHSDILTKMMKKSAPCPLAEHCC